MCQCEVASAEVYEVGGIGVDGVELHEPEPKAPAQRGMRHAEGHVGGVRVYILIDDLVDTGNTGARLFLRLVWLGQ